MSARVETFQVNGWRYSKPVASIERPCMSAIDANEGLLLLHAATTLFMVGLIWFVQVVHYPPYSRVGDAGFSQYERQHTRRTGWVVGIPMLAEIGASAALVWRSGGSLANCGLALLVIIWLSTWLLQVPAHRRLEYGFDAATHRRLVRTNWLRTVAWSGRGGIAIALLVAPG